LAPGLPDGIFSYQKSQCGYILRALVWKKVGILGHLEYVMDILVYFGVIWYIPISRLGMLYKEKSVLT
jgi:hypothetical protein